MDLNAPLLEFPEEFSEETPPSLFEPPDPCNTQKILFILGFFTFGLTWGIALIIWNCTPKNNRILRELHSYYVNQVAMGIFLFIILVFMIFCLIHYKPD